MNDIKKVVLAYSGGLDTSIILKWLQEEYGCEVVTFTADLGQGEELDPAREKAEMLGIKVLRAALDNKIIKRLAAVPVKLTIRAIHGLIWTPARIRALNG